MSGKEGTQSGSPADEGDQGDEPYPPYEPHNVSGSSPPNVSVPPSSGLHSQRYQYANSNNTRTTYVVTEPNVVYTQYGQVHPLAYGYPYDYGYYDDYYDSSGYLSLIVCCVLFIILVIITLTVLGSMGYYKRRRTRCYGDC